MRGGDELLERVLRGGRRRPPTRPTTAARARADGEFFVTGFECLGACDIAPMASIDERYYGPLDRRRRARPRSSSCAPASEALPDKALAKRRAAGGPSREPDARVDAKAEPTDA